MVSTRLFISFLSFGLLTTRALAQSSAFLNYFCLNDTGNYTANSTYQRNLITLLTSLPASNNSNGGYGFYYSFNGETPDRVYAIGQCAGEVHADDCRSCLNDSRVTLTKLCPNEKEAISWYDRCMLRYSDRSIYGVMETKPDFGLVNSQDVSASLSEVFVRQVKKLLESLRSQAASAGPLRKFAFGNTTAGDNQKIYAATQCTPDLPEKECSDCLEGCFGEYNDYGKMGGRIVKPSCKFGYEMFSFIDPADVVPLPLTSPPQPSITSTSPAGNDQIMSRMIVAVVVPIAIVLFLVGCFFLRRKARKKYDALQEQNVRNETSTVESLQFEFATIEAATNHFSCNNRLGEGGFGEVYKGTLPNGQEIAVKRLSRGSGQGVNEFENEVVLVAKLQHRNLVRILGFCSEGEEKILVYELVQNKSLDHFLFDLDIPVKLDWPQRYKIIGGIARGMLYLHEDSRLKIIHRDLKASNILLDREMNPKISDFGLARIFGVDQFEGTTRRIVGTYGYMSPEYAMHGQFSVKSDVYSLGILILEIITGKKNTNFHQSDHGQYLSTYAWKCWTDGTVDELLDPNLRYSYSRNEVIRCIHIGLLCVQEDPEARPTMQTIVLMLSSYTITLPLPEKPAFFLRSAVELNIPVSITINEASITELFPR